MGGFLSKIFTSTISPEDFEKQAEDASLKHYTTEPPPTIKAAILKHFHKIKDATQLIEYIYHISVKRAAEDGNVNYIECVLALHKAKEIFEKDGDCKAELKKIYDTYLTKTSDKNILTRLQLRPTSWSAGEALLKGSKDGFASYSDPTKFPWPEAEKTMQSNLYQKLDIGVTKDFESIKEQVVAAGFTYYIEKPPPLIASIIKEVYPKIATDEVKIKGVYDYLILFMDKGASTENIDFLNAMTKVRAMSKDGTDCSDELSKIFNHFWGTGATYNVNIGDKPKGALTAAAKDGFSKAEKDPNKGSWKTAVGAVKKMVKSVLEKVPKEFGYGQKIQELVSAHRSYYNELLDMDDSSIDNAQIAQSGYNYVGHGYEGHVIDGYKYIGTSHSSVYNGHGYFADPTAMVLIAISFCLCVGCVLFVNFISCVVGYIVGRYREEFVHSKEREREYEFEHV